MVRVVADDVVGARRRLGRAFPRIGGPAQKVPRRHPQLDPVPDIGVPQRVMPAVAPGISISLQSVWAEPG